MRVYVPATRAGLARLVAEGSIVPEGPSFGVTPSLTGWAGADGPAGDEEFELVALCEAARQSLRLIAEEAAEACRVVLAVDVPDGAAAVDDEGPEDPPGRVRLARAEVPLAWVAAVHLDEADARPQVLAAARAVGSADAGDPAAEAVVAVLDAHDLLWFDPVELPTL
jgi:hypothetical protein